MTWDRILLPIVVVGVLAVMAVIVVIIIFAQNILGNRITVDQFLTLVPVVIGAGTAMAGIFTYWEKKKNELLTQIIMPVLEKYYKLDDADIAIDILNNFPYEFDEKDKEDKDNLKAFKLYNKGEISKDDLPLLLRNDRWVDTSPVEDKVIKSFDDLLYFFAELEYIVELGLLKRPNLTLFQYEIDRAAEQEAILNFVNIQKLRFDGKIHDKFKLYVNQVVNIVGNEKDWKTNLKDAGYEIRTT